MLQEQISEQGSDGEPVLVIDTFVEQSIVAAVAAASAFFAFVETSSSEQSWPRKSAWKNDDSAGIAVGAAPVAAKILAHFSAVAYFGRLAHVKQTNAAPHAGFDGTEAWIVFVAAP